MQVLSTIKYHETCDAMNILNAFRKKYIDMDLSSSYTYTSNIIYTTTTLGT